MHVAFIPSWTNWSWLPCRLNSQYWVLRIQLWTQAFVKLKIRRCGQTLNKLILCQYELKYLAKSGAFGTRHENTTDAETQRQERACKFWNIVEGLSVRRWWGKMGLERRPEPVQEEQTGQVWKSGLLSREPVKSKLNIY